MESDDGTAFCQEITMLLGENSVVEAPNKPTLAKSCGRVVPHCRFHQSARQDVSKEGLELLRQLPFPCSNVYEANATGKAVRTEDLREPRGEHGVALLLPLLVKSRVVEFVLRVCWVKCSCPMVRGGMQNDGAAAVPRGLSALASQANKQ